MLVRARHASLYLLVLDVTAANLAIETFLPMNPESAARLAELDAPRSA